MDNTNDRQLSFPQRNWFLLCVIVAILSPLVVHWVQAAAHKQSYQQSVDVRPAHGDSGATGGANAGGKDTSYKVAAPPSTDSSKKGGGGVTDTFRGGTGSKKP
jgi:hypothetical protein